MATTEQKIKASLNSDMYKEQQEKALVSIIEDMQSKGINEEQVKTIGLYCANIFDAGWTSGVLYGITKEKSAN